MMSSRSRWSTVLVQQFEDLYAIGSVAASILLISICMVKQKGIISFSYAVRVVRSVCKSLFSLSKTARAHISAYPHSVWCCVKTTDVRPSGLRTRIPDHRTITQETEKSLTT